MSEFVFTYGLRGTEVNQDFDGGFTMVHAPNIEVAFDLFHAVHKRKNPTTPSFAGCYTEADLIHRGITAEHFGKCHDHIVYAELLGGDD